MKLSQHLLMQTICGGGDRVTQERIQKIQKLKRENPEASHKFVNNWLQYNFYATMCFFWELRSFIYHKTLHNNT
jgi:hypothetical protein